MGDCISATGERRQCKGTFAFAAAEPHHVDLARKSRREGAGFFVCLKDGNKKGGEKVNRLVRMK
jgi:hypothetical protein